MKKLFCASTFIQFTGLCSLAIFLSVSAPTFAAASASTTNTLGGALTGPSLSSDTSWSVSGNNIFNNNSGNVGIGSSTPYATLSVTPAAGATPFAVSFSTGLNLFSLNQYGEASFGNGTNADILINGGGTSPNLTSGYNNIALGNQAFSFYATSYAQNNIALGYQALYGSSTVPMTGQNNFAAGYQALSGDTTGQLNTAIGYKTLLNNTTGSDNNAIGEFALTSNTTGTENNAIGQSALENNTTGTQNTAIGLDALFSNITGSNNNALGYQAAYSNTTGSNNNAIGYGALTFNSTGSYNNAIGYQALNNTNGSYNTALGYQAGFSLTAGSDNIMIGHVKNTGGNNITTGSNNITLGYNAAIGSSSNSNNFLNIGNSFFGVMNATSTKALLPTTNDASFSVGSSSVSSTGGVLWLGSDPGTKTGSTTIQMGRIQLDGYNSTGSRVCVFVVGSVLKVSPGSCTP